MNAPISPLLDLCALVDALIRLRWERRFVAVVGIGFLSAGTALAFRGQEGTATVVVLVVGASLVFWGLGIRPPKLKVGDKSIHF